MPCSTEPGWGRGPPTVSADTPFARFDLSRQVGLRIGLGETVMEAHLSADGREALIDLQVFSEVNGRGLTDVQAVIDTGFTGFLTLPGATVQSLSLPLFGSREVVLADGSVSSLDVYRAEILCHNKSRPVSVLQSEGGPLVGMSLLRESSLREWR